jgi:hypothetical protein
MSLPDEKARAVTYAREWLYRLLDRKYKPTMTEIRSTACRLLRHYPWAHDVEIMLKALEAEQCESISRLRREATGGTRTRSRLPRSRLGTR